LFYLFEVLDFGFGFGFDLRSFTCLATPKIAAPWATDDIKAPVQMGQGI
jgi:hypothetical protein